MKRREEAKIVSALGHDSSSLSSSSSDDEDGKRRRRKRRKKRSKKGKHSSKKCVIILRVFIVIIASRGKKQAKVVESPPSSDSAEEESDEDGVWVEKKISTIISLAFYLSLLFVSKGKDADGAFIGPVPEIKPQGTNNKMEYIIIIPFVLFFYFLIALVVICSQEKERQWLHLCKRASVYHVVERLALQAMKLNSMKMQDS